MIEYTNIPIFFVENYENAASISKVAILAIALGALVILLLILVAACRPYNPNSFPECSPDKPGTFLSSSFIFVTPAKIFAVASPNHGVIYRNNMLIIWIWLWSSL